MEELIKETDFDRVMKKVTSVYEGHSEASLPMGFNRLEKHVSIRKGMYFLVSGYTGSSKSTLIESAFILNPYEWWEKHQNFTKTKIKILYFSMERSKEFKIIKWTLRKLFLDTGVLIEVGSCLGWRGFPKLTQREYELFAYYKKYIDGMLDSGIIEIHEGPTNPMHIKKIVDDYAKSVGKFEKIDEFKSVYVPNDPNQMLLIIKDHIGLLRKEKREGVLYSTRKDIIDLSSTDDQKFRDQLGAVIVNVSQNNRSIADPARLKQTVVDLNLEDIKDSSNTAEAADVVIGILDPIRYNIPDPCGYDLNALRDSQGNKYYRYLKVMKNSYGSDGISIGIALQPQLGICTEMVKKDIITVQDYEDIRKGSYFRR